ncbi:hypothetical protein DFH11DRAFT_892672 [Phellopilus nigrolimitatus]|nr:hypothetical protein DFH11DRAFT_892672 [Phellopilus nigrolimitatus]
MLFTSTFKSSLLLIAGGALLAAHVRAQSGSGTGTSLAADPTSAAVIGECITTCVGSAAYSAGCANYSDLTCVCTSSAFQTIALQCLQSSCSSGDMTTALGLQQSWCGSVSASSSETASSTACALPSSSVAATLAGRHPHAPQFYQV